MKLTRPEQRKLNARPETVRITSVVEHVKQEANCDPVSTIRFKYPQPASPGQFVMVWVPGVDELPMSLSYIGEEKGITVREVGPGTKELLALSQGDMIGIRGPYGRGYRMHERDVDAHVLVGGGTGTASLLPYARRLREEGGTVHAVVGAKTCDEMFLLDEYETVIGKDKLTITTDDGTMGTRGFATQAAFDLLDALGDNIGVSTCGPEIMMKILFDFAAENGMEFEASLERIMKCGVGICDSCALGKYKVCKDGPVFSGRELTSVNDFGRIKRGPSGRRIPL